MEVEEGVRVGSASYEATTIETGKATLGEGLKSHCYELIKVSVDSLYNVTPPDRAWTEYVSEGGDGRCGGDEVMMRSGCGGDVDCVKMAADVVVVGDDVDGGCDDGAASMERKKVVRVSVVVTAMVALGLVTMPEVRRGEERGLRIFNTSE
nr:hypothetical protein [Tanacetum cinerariifolium]